MRLRTADPAYLAAVDQWFDQLIPVLAELQTSRGGPIVAVQVENEYGSYGNDKAYLEHLKDSLLARGIDCLLFTSDGPEARMLAGGTLPGVLATANFGSRPAEAFDALAKFQPGAPLVCMEFWNGWFDHFGDPHHIRDSADAAEALDGILAAGDRSTSTWATAEPTSVGGPAPTTPARPSPTPATCPRSPATTMTHRSARPVN